MPVASQLDPDKETRTAHLADQLVPHVAQSGEQALADDAGVRCELLVAHHIERGLCRGDRDGVAAEGVEVANLATEGIDEVPARHDGGDRVAVAHRLSDGDEVGHQAVAIEAPHAGTQPAEAGLHLVGDEQAAALSDRGHGIRQSGQIGQHTVGGEDRVHDECCGGDAVGGKVG